MVIAFGTRAPSQAAMNSLRKARTDAHMLREACMASEKPASAIMLDAHIAHQWPVRDQFGRGTCVAFATLAAVELSSALGTDMLPERLSEQFLHDVMVQKHPLPAAVAEDLPEGGVLLRQAWHALREHGVIGAEKYPYKSHIFSAVESASLPPEDLARAAQNRIIPLAYGTIGKVEHMECGGFDEIEPNGQTAARILGFLQMNRPVAMGVPLFQHPSGLSNWTLPSAMSSGIVLCPQDANAPVLEGPRSDGHVVCVTGFLPDPNEPMGGWFVFRNSWGLEFASHATLPSAGITARRRGYGVISATHVNAYCWEYLVPGPLHV